MFWASFANNGTDWQVFDYALDCHYLHQPALVHNTKSGCLVHTTLAAALSVCTSSPQKHAQLSVEKTRTTRALMRASFNRFGLDGRDGIHKDFVLKNRVSLFPPVFEKSSMSLKSEAPRDV
jgi:hypothetical protein